MEFPANLAEKEVVEILEKEGMIDQAIPPPVYRPDQSFDEPVHIWRRRLFPILGPLGTGLANFGLYSLAPSYYRWENSFYIGSISMVGAIAGILIAEGISYYLAIRNS